MQINPDGRMESWAIFFPYQYFQDQFGAKIKSQHSTAAAKGKVTETCHVPYLFWKGEMLSLQAKYHPKHLHLLSTFQVNILNCEFAKQSKQSWLILRRCK